MTDLNHHKAKFCKLDFRQLYDNVEMNVFESWIADIMPEIGWIPGKKQVFPPKVASRIFEHIGQPINYKILNQ